MFSLFFLLNDIERTNITSQVKLGSINTCKSTSMSVGYWIKGVSDSLEILAANTSISDLGNRDLLEKKFKILSDSNPDIKEVVFANREGYANSFGTKITDVRSKPFYVEIIKNKTKSIFGQASYSSDYGKTPQILLARAIVDNKANTIGVISLTISLNTVLERIKSTKIGGGGVAWLLDSDGRVIVPPNDKVPLFSKISSVNSNADIKFLIFLDNLNNSKTGDATYKDSKGKDIFSNYSEVPFTNGWRLIISNEVDEMLAPLKNFQDIMFYVGIIAYAFAIFMTIIISRQVTKNLFSLVREVNKISTHKMNVVNLKGASFEIQQLEESINSMSDEISQYTNYLEEKVESRTKELRESQKKLEYLSFHDPLTGLKNRSYFDSIIKKLDTEQFLPFSIVMGDVNNLKLANDIFGHREGDNLLIEMANIIASSVKISDVAIRWGGDEFIILMPNSSKVEAEALCKKIKLKCKKAEKHMMPISISLGYCEKSEASEQISDVIKEADKMLYTSKMSEGKIAKTKIVQALREKLANTSIETFDHQERVEKLSVLLSKRLQLSKTDMDDVRSLSNLHSIGKIGIPSRLLMKEGKLTDEEKSIVNTHSEIGYRIAQATPEISRISALILAYNEWWDGSGYPLSLKGNNIPLLSRIVSIVDIYDTLTHHKIYGHVMSNNEALEEIAKYAGTRYDPKLVKEFDALIRSKI